MYHKYTTAEGARCVWFPAKDRDLEFGHYQTLGGVSEELPGITYYHDLVTFEGPSLMWSIVYSGL